MTVAIVVLALVILVGVVMFIREQERSERIKALGEIMRLERDKIRAEFDARRDGDISSEIQAAKQRDKEWPR